VIVLQTKQETRAQIAAARARGERVALVPTMGYLHDGHMSLVDRARSHADVIVMSIFVNPLQFGPREDFSTYPRSFERDCELARTRGVDFIFAPSAQDMYGGEEPAVRVVPVRMADVLCGAFRPGHFDGVLTVVAKLFEIVQPHVALFGQKDFQQATLIRRMVADLDMPLEVVIGPVVREPDGLAMSSRNVYLSAEERAHALSLSRALFATRAAFDAGERSADRLLAAARGVLQNEPGVDVQYVELVHPDTLGRISEAEPGSVLALAGFVGKTRLIDNIVLGVAE
jgi:pantoate--beta-alanine ligase